MYGLAYLDEIRKGIDFIQETQWPAMEKAAAILTDVVEKGGLIHVFGPGHAHIMAVEIGRASGLPLFNQILDPDLMPFFGPQVALMENLEGYGAILLSTYDTRPGEAIIVASMAGRCAVAIDIALAAKRQGLTVIGVTGVEYTQAFEPWHSSGKRLMDISDIVIDNMSPIGEGAVQMEGVPHKVGPSTTVLSATILNALQVMVTEGLLQRGITPPVNFSANVDYSPEERQRFQKARERFAEAIQRRGRRVMPAESLREILDVSKGYTAKET